MSGEFNWQQVLGEQPRDEQAAAPAAPAPTAGQHVELESLINAIPDRSGLAPAPDYATPAVAQPPAVQPMEAPTAFEAHDAPSMAVPPAAEPVAPTPSAPAAPATSPYETPRAYNTSETTHLPNYMLVDDPDATTAPKRPDHETNAWRPEEAQVYQMPQDLGAIPEQFRVQSTEEMQPTTPVEMVTDATGLTIPKSLLEPELNAKKYELFGEKDRAALSEVSGAQELTDLHLDDILRVAVERKASDIHITVGLPPMARIDGEIIQLPYKLVKPMDARRLMFEIMSDERVTKFETNHELDFSHSVREVGRFRVNVYMQRGAVAAAIRTIPTRIPTFEELELPEILREMCKRTSGLILVTGPTGSGKSTTIATMINDVNDTLPGHILTLEDPIEYIHTHKRCMVNQREMHSDTYSFHNALRAVLREDPDIILVGELRDHETIEAALTLAETGHLVFGTLHTRNAPATIDRIIDVFPSDQQSQIRVLLGNTLEGIVSQQLLPKIGGGRRAALEVMLGVPAVRNLIREGKTHQMYSVIETSKNVGMMTMDSSLAHLFKTGQCTWDECMMRAVDKDNFTRLAKSAA